MWRVKKRLLLILLSASMPTLSFAASPRPPAIPLQDSPATYFDTASLGFHIPGFSDPVIIRIRLQLLKSEVPAGLQDMEISYGSHMITAGRDVLADIKTPDLMNLSVTAFKIDNDSKTVIVVYVIDQALDCTTRSAPGCGVVEFDWTVGEKLKKVDQRASGH
jgi:hypothetical protein